MKSTSEQRMLRLLLPHRPPRVSVWRPTTGCLVHSYTFSMALTRYASAEIPALESIAATKSTCPSLRLGSVTNSKPHTIPTTS